MLVEARTIRIQFAKKYKQHFKFLHRLNRRQFFETWCITVADVSRLHSLYYIINWNSHEQVPVHHKQSTGKITNTDDRDY